MPRELLAQILVSAATLTCLAIAGASHSLAESISSQSLFGVPLKITFSDFQKRYSGAHCDNSDFVSVGAPTDCNFGSPGDRYECSTRERRLFQGFHLQGKFCVTKVDDIKMPVIASFVSNELVGLARYYDNFPIPEKDWEPIIAPMASTVDSLERRFGSKALQECGTNSLRLAEIVVSDVGIVRVVGASCVPWEYSKTNVKLVLFINTPFWRRIKDKREKEIQTKSERISL